MQPHPSVARVLVPFDSRASVVRVFAGVVSGKSSGKYHAKCDNPSPKVWLELTVWGDSITLELAWDRYSVSEPVWVDSASCERFGVDGTFSQTKAKQTAAVSEQGNMCAHARHEIGFISSEVWIGACVRTRLIRLRRDALNDIQLHSTNLTVSEYPR
jgi:hypothetical protein